MATSPATHPDLYTYVFIGGQASPGTVTLSGFDSVVKFDDQQPKGAEGEFTVCKGKKNGGFTATFFLATIEQVAAWDEFQRMLAASRKGAKPKALSAYHPDLVRNEILDVVVESIGGMSHDGKGGCTVVCKFKEYRPPKPKPATKASAQNKARTGTTTVNDPNAARKAELAALLEQARQP